MSEIWPDTLENAESLFSSVGRLIFVCDMAISEQGASTLANTNQAHSSLVWAFHDFYNALDEFTGYLNFYLGSLSDGVEQMAHYPTVLKVLDAHPDAIGAPLMRQLVHLAKQGHGEKIEQLAAEMLPMKKVSRIRGNAMAKEFFAREGLPEWKKK